MMRHHSLLTRAARARLAGSSGGKRTRTYSTSSSSSGGDLRTLIACKLGPAGRLTERIWSGEAAARRSQQLANASATVADSLLECIDDASTGFGDRSNIFINLGSMARHSGKIDGSMLSVSLSSLN